MAIISESAPQIAPATRPASAEQIHDLLRLWLRAQCAAVPGVRCGIAVAVGEPDRPVAVWPPDFVATPVMLASARRALAGHRENVLAGSRPEHGQRIAAPLIRNGKRLGALVIEAATATEQQRSELQHALRAARPAGARDDHGAVDGTAAAPADCAATAASRGAGPASPNPTPAGAPATSPRGPGTDTSAAAAAPGGTPRDGESDTADGARSSAATPGRVPLHDRNPNPRASQHRLATVVDLLATCVDAGGFEDAALALCNELATRLTCTRVSAGVVVGQEMRLIAMSHSAVLDARSNLVTDIRFAMTEATDQGRAVVFPAAPQATELNAAQAALARRERSAGVVSVPLAENGSVIGALTLQREHDQPFDDHTLATLDALAAIVGPLLALKRRDGRSPLRYGLESAAALTARVAGPRHTKRKLGAVAVALLLAWMATVDAPYRITAPAHLEGSIQRAVVAPLDGYVAQSHARAGDTVIAGDLIARLDDRELLLERSRMAGELDQLRTQYRGARAAHDRAQGAVINARIARAEAQLALLDAQLERTMLRAPIDGMVIAGDLSQLLGSPVARGDVLFEVAPLSGYRVVIEVDERDIRSVARGQSGQLALEGLAGEKLAVVVEQTTPVSQPRDGRNAFRVEAGVSAAPDKLRPGMAGYVRIDAGERRLLWIWTHRISEWLRLKTWTWWP